MTELCDTSPKREFLAFRLPDIFRLSWVSAQVQALWASRLRRVQYAWYSTEIASVRVGLRRCCLVFAGPAAVNELGAKVAGSDLSVLPLVLNARSAYGYSTGSPGSVAAHADLRVVLGSGRDVGRFYEAWLAQDDATIGRMLGYPECCVRFFCELWNEREQIDTIWEMASASRGVSRSGRVIDVSPGGATFTNILIRQAGPRLCPHLPCSFDCEASVALAKTMLQTMRDSGFVIEADWVLEALRWPVEWSALHGAAETRTPLFRAISRTDPTAHEYTVRLHSRDFPKEGANGKHFPYRTPGGHNSRIAERIVQLRRGRKRDQPPSHVLNGFRDEEVMVENHRRVAEAALQALFLASRNPQQGHMSLVDLGCGDGALLASVAAQSSGVVCYGVDRSVEATEAAQARFEDADARFLNADMGQFGRLPVSRVDVCIVMVGRLLECPDLISSLKAFSRYLVVYAYPGWTSDSLELEQALLLAGLKATQVYGGIAAVVPSEH